MMGILGEQPEQILFSLAVAAAIAFATRPLLSWAATVPGETAARLKSIWVEHSKLLAEGRRIRKQRRGPQPRNADDNATGEDVSFWRIAQEVWRIMRLRFILPATIISVAMTFIRYMEPNVHGKILDLVSRPGATMADVVPLIQRKLLLSVITFASTMSTTILFATSRWDMTAALRYRCFRALLRQDMEVHDAAKPGELAARLRNDPELIQELANRSMEKLLKGVVNITSGAFILLRYRSSLAFAAVALKVLPDLLLLRTTSEVVSALGATRREGVRAAEAAAAEALDNVATVRAANAEDHEEQLYKLRTSAYLGATQHSVWASSLLGFASSTLSQLVSDGVLCLGAWHIVQGEMTLGDFTAFQSYLSSFLQGYKEIAKYFMEVTSLRVGAAGYFELMDMVPIIEQPHDEARPTASSAAAATLSPKTGPNASAGSAAAPIAVQWNDVVFSYPSRRSPLSVSRPGDNLDATFSKLQLDGNRLEETANGDNGASDIIKHANAGAALQRALSALRGVSISAERGKMLALCGVSGSGKSTLLKLALRFYDVEGGSVKVFDRDVRSWSAPQLRRQISYLTQRTVLFDRPIYENIAYGMTVDLGTTATTGGGSGSAASGFNGGSESGIRNAEEAPLLLPADAGQSLYSESNASRPESINDPQPRHVADSSGAANASGNGVGDTNPIASSQRRVVTLADIERAARLANAHDFIMALPGGYMASPGRGGRSLSGGQLQRVAIARLVLQDAPIVFLDEPTDALDAENEARIREALARVLEGRTCVVIAHRMSTVARADRICVLRDGSLLQEGTHLELMAEEKGEYAKFVEAQLIKKGA